jgi:hypothetical protein
MKNAGAMEGMHAHAAAGGEARGESKAVFPSRVRGDSGLSSGLDELADVVASSGLSGSGMGSGLSKQAKLREKPAPAPKNKLMPLLVIGAIVIILLLGVVIGLLMKGSGGGENKESPAPAEPGKSTAGKMEPAVAPPSPAPRPEAAVPLPALPAPDPKVTGPAFFGVKVDEPSIIFLIDRGSATHESFEYMKMACLNALDTLRPEQKYQIIFWKLDKDREPVIIPRELTAAGNKGELKKTADAVEEVTSFGQSDLKPALEKAFAAKPAAVVIATGKPLDDGFVKWVIDARKNAAVKVHCLSMVEPSSNKPMRDVAGKTGGTFKFISLSELQSVRH